MQYQFVRSFVKNSSSWKRSIQAFDNVSAEKQENYCKSLLASIVTKYRTFTSVLYAHSQFLCILARFELCKPECASASPAAHFLYSTARIRQYISAASFAVVNCYDAVMNSCHTATLGFELHPFWLRPMNISSWPCACMEVWFVSCVTF